MYLCANFAQKGGKKTSTPNVVLIKNIYHYDPDTTTESRT